MNFPNLTITHLLIFVRSRHARYLAYYRAAPVSPRSFFDRPRRDWNSGAPETPLHKLLPGLPFVEPHILATTDFKVGDRIVSLCRVPPI